ncbi:MAG: ABC transporter substrate-binding protein [Chloroflexi bacterium]|nr:ABC transporter substrate-binding protein [Chloroflexota bacterium]
MKVKIATQGFTSDAGIFLAMDKGYFKEQGIDAEWVLIVRGTDTFPLLATGEMQVAGGTIDAALFNAIQRGVNVKMVADKASNPKGSRFVGVTVRKDLADQIKTTADLKDRTIAMGCEACQTDFLVELWLKDGNLTFNDVKKVIMYNPADHIPALANKTVEVAHMMEPFITIATDQGLVVPWLWAGDRDPGQTGSVVLFSEAFAKDVDAGRRFMLAYLKGVRDYNDAINKGKNKADLVAILSKYTSLKDPKLYDKVGMPGLNVDGKINLPSMVQLHDFLLRTAAIKEKADLTKIVDMQFADYAAQRLGPYN